MRRSGTDSWRVSVRTDPLIDCALWIRAAERLDVPADPLVPGPADIDHPPAPISTASADRALAQQWLGWWYTLVAPQETTRAPDPGLEPAYGSPDPLGLAPYPALAAIVTRRLPEANGWHTECPRSSVISDVVRDVERTAGRTVRPFDVEFVLIAVRDEVIRPLDARRHLVPCAVYAGPAWDPWLRALITRIGL